jgi:putative MATE family efflux protein
VPTVSAQPPAALLPSQKELGGKLAGLSLPRQVFALALWPFLENLLNFLVGFTDMAVAGHLGDQAKEATASISTGVYVNWMQNMILASICVGSSAVISRAVGARHKREANAMLGQGILLGFCSGTTIGALIFLFAPFITDLLHMEGATREFCISYLRIMAFSGPIIGVLSTANAGMRASGDTRTPFFIMLLVNLVNIALTLLLTFGPEPIGGHGVKGIAIGTVLSWAVGAGLAVWSLTRRQTRGIQLYPHRLKPRLRDASRIVRVGLPNLGEGLGMWAGNFLVFMIVGALKDPTAVGAHGIAIRVEAISYMPGMALGIAAATLVGQYMGLGDLERARRAVMISWYMAASLMGFAGLIIVIFPRQMVGLVTSDPELITTSANALQLAGFVQFFFSGYMVFSQAMRGAGDTRAAMIISNVLTFGVRLPGAYIVGVVYGGGLYGIWAVLCVELALRGTFFFLRFRQGKWMTKRV